MKQCKSLKFILFLILVLNMQNISAQYITLKGKQFYDASGHPFYPVICNYGLTFYCNSCTGSGAYPEDMDDGTLGAFDPADVDIYTSPGYQDVTIPFGNGLGYIQAGFAKVKAMGFNTVRLIGWGAWMNLSGINGHDCGPDWPADVSFCMPYTNPGHLGISCMNYNGTYSNDVGYPIAYTPPYSTDPNFNNVMMPKIKQVLQLAQDQDLKVILDCIWGGTFSDNDADANKANDMMVAIASSLAADPGGHPELLAYDWYNEPHWKLWGGGNTYLKNKICTYTSMWYDNMKAVDPNHLITNGDVDPQDVFDWDPAVMKLDFNCVHPYPDFYRTAYDGYDEANMTSRYQALLYWEANNSPMPWIIAETGVGANTTSSSGYNTGTGTWGTLADQSAWATQIQEIAINTGASGFGWWDFAAPNYGLLYPGHPNSLGGGVYAYDNSHDKPIVAGAFSGNVVTTATAQISQPADYYNAWGGAYYTWSGTVQDQDGNPIQDAVIQAQNGAKHSGYTNSHDGSPKVPDAVSFSIITFSKADGSFDLIAPVPSPSSILLNPPNNYYDYGKFDHIQVSAPGASVVTPWDQQPIDPSGAPSSGMVTLERKVGVFDKQVSGLDINSSNSTGTAPYVATARHALITGADIVETTGYADLHASSMVAVQAGTSSQGIAAERGSYTHIYCAPVDFDCSQLLSPAYKKFGAPKNNSVDTPSAETGKSITVNYSLASGAIRLMPNPATDYFYLSAQGGSPVGAVEIADAAGHSVYSGTIAMDGQTPLGISGLATGFYTVYVNSSADRQVFKLIVSR